MCDLGENSPPFVSMPLAAMRKAVDYLSGERKKERFLFITVATGHVTSGPCRLSGHKRANALLYERKQPFIASISYME